ncbi:MAG: transcriptional repressor LexA, partial [Candidatus Omnitrophica bacterium]|nr:transcriptional repressor LexA [Candidatus Omnitrophota bacterium]
LDFRIFFGISYNKMLKQSLTPKQKKILNFIINYTKKHDYAPSLEEIAKHFRLKAISTIHQYIETLKNKGYLKKEENKARSIKPLNKDSQIIEIPLLGYIAAGQPIEAIENPETIEVSQQLLQKYKNDVFALKVKGNSMIEEGIFDGDIVLIKKQETAENGETVVAIINKNEATLKKFYREKDRIRLQPANQSLLPIFTNDIEIRGKVISIIRNIKEEKQEKLAKNIFINNQFIQLPQSIEPIVFIGDVIKALKKIPDKSIDLIITSPPYYQQRNYGIKGEIGQESTPDEYIIKMLEVANELRRVLKDSGSYFLNIGDKYINKNQQLIPFRLAIEMQKNGWLVRNVIVWHKSPNPMPTSIKDRFNDIWEPIIFFVKNSGKYYTYDYYFNLDPVRIPHKTKFEINLPLTLSEEEYLKIKDKLLINKNGSTSSKFIGHENNRGASPGARKILYGEYYTKQRKYKISHELEIEIINYLRIWRKLKGISAKEIDKIMGKKDTASHWFRLDHGRSLPSPEDWIRLKKILQFDNKYDKIMTEQHYVLQTVKYNPNGKNPGNVWSISPAKLKEAHFAVFPEELPRKIIEVCCPKNGIVLDPFAGSGTTGKVAKELERKSILIDIKEEYAKIMKKRCGKIKIIKID